MSRSLNPRDVAALTAVAVLALMSVWMRWPGLDTSGFASHDVAGITYNAQLLLAGDLPYRESVEMKAPLSFHLAAAVAPPGRGVPWVVRLHRLANLWALLTWAGAVACAWRLFGRRAGVAMGALLGLHDACLDSMDANYVTWANLPALLAAWSGLEARRARGTWRRVLLWGLAGVLAGVAAQFKRPAAFVGPALAIMAWFQGGSPKPLGARVRLAAGAWLALALGVVLAHLPLVAVYVREDAGLALWEGYVMNRWGRAYVAAGGGGASSPVALVREGVLAAAHFVALPLLWGAWGVGRIASDALRGRGGGNLPAASAVDRGLAWSLLAWVFCMAVATALGGRFYKGYFSTFAPALCLLAVSPWGFPAAWSQLWRSGWAWRVVVLAGVLGSGALAARQASFDLATRVDRAQPHDLGSRAITALIEPELEPDDRIWVWGWHLWDVYTYADALSGSRIYKSLGLLTPPNDDTWRRPASPPRFVDGPMAELLVRELEASQPKWIVLGSNAPSRGFAALRRLLRRDYRRDRSKRLNRVQFWRRRGP